MQSTIIARIPQERRVHPARALADHVQWTRRPATAATQEQQHYRHSISRHDRCQAEMGSVGHIVCRPRGYIQEQDHLGNIASLHSLPALLVKLPRRK